MNASRQHEAALGVLPADQRLDPGQRAGPDRNLWLVEQQQLVAVERPAKAAPRTIRSVAGRAPTSETNARLLPPDSFAAVHRDVGVLEQGRRILAVVGKHRDPDACAESALLPVQHERLGQRFQQAQPEFIDVDLIRDVFGEHDELVAAQPGDRVGVPDRLR